LLSQYEILALHARRGDVSQKQRRIESGRHAFQCKQRLLKQQWAQG